MPFPKVEHCIVCEEARQEVLRKTTLMGFYGITPNVSILVQDFGQAVARLTFLLLTEPASGGTYTVGAEIISPDGQRLTEFPAKPGPATQDKRLALGFAVNGLVLPKPGEYRFRLMVDRNQHHETTFRVEQGSPKDFQP